MFKQYVVLLILVVLNTVSVTANADEETEHGAPAFAYYTLAPDLTTNVYTTGNTLRYVQVRIDLMVADSGYVVELEKHEPLIRDTIVDYIGQQSEDHVKTLAGREALRKQLIEMLNSLLVEETGKALITDLLFTKFLFQ